MRKICIINQKGGVGKTTTAVSIAAGLARNEKKVLLVDLDPQGNIAHSLISTKEKSVYDFLVGDCAHVDCISTLGTNLDLMHSTETLTKIEMYFAQSSTPQHIVRERFNELSGYDYVIFDCAPSLGLLNQNVMIYSSEAIIPVSTTYLSMTGLQNMLEAIEEVNKHFSSELQVSYIVPTMHDKRNKGNCKVHEELKNLHADKVTNPIRINAKLAEAPRSGKSIFSFDPSSRGAKDYGQLVSSIIEDEQKYISKESSSEPISARVQRMMADVYIED